MLKLSRKGKGGTSTTRYKPERWSGKERRWTCNECVLNYITTKPGGVNEPTLTHHTFFTTKLIPKLDHLIDDKNMGKMREMTCDLTAVVFSDGRTAVNHHPIVNIIMGVRSLHTLRASIDTMGFIINNKYIQLV
jgi:hypothetical protein